MKVPSYWSPQAARSFERWLAVVPYRIASEQVKWERCMIVRRALDQGIKLSKLARHLNVCRATVDRYDRVGQRWLPSIKSSPVERYFEEKLDLSILCGKTKPT